MACKDYTRFAPMAPNDFFQVTFVTLKSGK
jgi:hypothetical protein